MLSQLLLQKLVLEHLVHSVLQDVEQLAELILIACEFQCDQATPRVCPIHEQIAHRLKKIHILHKDKIEEVFVEVETRGALLNFRSRRLAVFILDLIFHKVFNHGSDAHFYPFLNMLLVQGWIF